MWLVTTIGFFSVVQKPWDRDADTLTVRARALGDLEGFKRSCCTALGEIVEDGDADYRFRAQGPRAAVVAAVGGLAEGIDYQNFKSAVAKRQGPERAHVYGAVWEDLLAIQREPRR
jgi:hypothetical protein